MVGHGFCRVEVSNFAGTGLGFCGGSVARILAGGKDEKWLWEAVLRKGRSVGSLSHRAEKAVYLIEVEDLGVERTPDPFQVFGVLWMVGICQGFKKIPVAG